MQSRRAPTPAADLETADGSSEPLLASSGRFDPPSPIMSPVLSPSERQRELDTVPDATEVAQRDRCYRESILVTIPVFAGYAALFSQQASLKEVLGIADNTGAKSDEFGAYVSALYLGNLLLRAGHNVVFAPLQPRQRVLMSVLSMACSMTILLLVTTTLHEPSLLWVLFAYLLGGIAVGTFEANVLGAITPLGKGTKLWAIVGLPVGVMTMTIGGFSLVAVGVHVSFLYGGVLVALLLGVVAFMVRIYPAARQHQSPIELSELKNSCLQWREWMPQIKWNCCAMVVNMFCVSIFSPGVILYIYDRKTVALTPFNHLRMNTNWLFVIYDAFFSVGDTLSRKIYYGSPQRNPLWFLVFSLLGIICGLSDFAVLVPICGLLTAFCNGSIYAQTTRRIDLTIASRYNLIALSFWLFIGDVGSVIGSNIINYLAALVHHLYGPPL